MRASIRSLADDPTPPDSIAMRGKGTGLHRLRVGNYRVVYRVLSDQLVEVAYIRHCARQVGLRVVRSRKR